MIRKVARTILWHISALPYMFSTVHNHLVIVSAADHTHGQSLQQLIGTVFRWLPHAEFICYDLGMTNRQRTQVDTLLSQFPRSDLRKFQFDNFPPHFDMSEAAGQYAWKPAIISEVSMGLNDATLLWLDAGNIVCSRLNSLRRIIRKDGLYSPWSRGRIADWTHFGMIGCLQFPVELLNRRNLNAAVLGFDCSNSRIRHLIDQWFHCALDVTCISPLGSSRVNHRQDQAALTLIAYKLGLVKSFRHHFINELWEPAGISTHCDID